MSQVENYESAYNDQPSALQQAVDMFEAFETAGAVSETETPAQMELNEEQLEERFAQETVEAGEFDAETSSEDELVKAATDEEIEEELKLLAEPRQEADDLPFDERIINDGLKPPEGELI